MKKIISILLIALLAITSVFATKISINYNGTDYVLNTARTISSTDTAYFNGMYDGMRAAFNGTKLHEIYDALAAKTFENDTQKSMYLEAYADFMTNYAYGTMGRWNDIYPLYAGYLALPASYENAQEITLLGDARFFPDL